MCLSAGDTLPWTNEVQWLNAHWKSKSFPNQVRRLVYVGVVYHIWEARNQALFKHMPVKEEDITHEVHTAVRDVVAGWKKFPVNKTSLELAIELGLPLTCFS